MSNDIKCNDNVQFTPFAALFAEPKKNGLTRPSKERGAGYRMVNMGELFAYDFIHSQDMERVQLSEKEKLTYLLKAGDLLFARQSLTVEGTGKCSLVTQLSEETTFESHLIRCRLNTQVASPLYFYYFFRSPYAKKKMSGLVSKVSASGVKGSDLEKFPVPIVDIETQNNIATVLHTYDKKIELNNEFIQLAEEQLQLVYEYWFLQYDFPDENGRPYRSSGGKMKWSEVMQQEIPTYWSCATLGDIAEIARGTRVDDNYETYISTDDMLQNKKGIDYAIKRAPIARGIASRPHDILISNIRPYLKKIWYSDMETSVSADVLVFRSKTQASGFLYATLRRDDFFTHMMTGAKGVKMPRGDKAQIMRYPVIIPPTATVKAFEKYAQTILEIISIARRENIDLAAQRDFLLPLLMSGQVKVAE